MDLSNKTTTSDALGMLDHRGTKLARRAATRERILAAAGYLLYNEGIRATGVDAIADRAGVAKRTLYKYFRSKDDLIEAYLRQVDQSSRQRFEYLMGPSDRPIEQQVSNLFRELGRQAANIRWKGCSFAKAAIELAGLPGHPAKKVAREHSARFQGWITEALAADGMPDAAKMARRIMVLVNGVILESLISHDPQVAREAEEMAVELVANARWKARAISEGLARAC